MGKIVMPKNSALLTEIESVLKIYYDEDDWLSNDVYKDRLKAMIGADQYSSSYTKKAQITSYFGFTIWEDIKNAHSNRKITESGKEMYRAIMADDTEKIQSVLMKSLETVKFGRNNYGCPDSDSDVEPPALFIRASMDLEYLTYKEFAYLLWKLEDQGGNYTDEIIELKKFRSEGGVPLSEEANKYADCKPIMILLRWGFLVESSDSSIGGKHISVAPDVIHRYSSRLSNLKIYNIDMDCDVPITDNDKEVGLRTNTERVKGGTNILLYGVPGSGKSYKVDEIIDNKTKSERIVFHPDYTYADFIGQIMPKLEKSNGGNEERLTYKFIPGPFTKIIKLAINDPGHMYYLVIEEINRGNAPAIFGDIFQLLDRDDTGNGEYHITNFDIAKEVYDGDENHDVIMPSNLTVLATMNTSDQNVFTLDTAFQRRWDMEYIRNNVANAKHAGKKIEESSITWGAFATVVNEEILEYNIELSSSEDKQLGAYFVMEEELAENRFPEKALKYLWDDAFKLDRDKVFDESIKSIGELVSTYEDEAKKHHDPIKGVMKAEVYKRMFDMQVDLEANDIDGESEVFDAEIIHEE